MNIELEILPVEEITLDHSNMPLDCTEGAEARDILLDDLLHRDEWVDIDMDITNLKFQRF